MSELVLTLVLHFRSCSRRAVCPALVYQIAQGGGTFAGSRWWPVTDRLAVLGAVLQWNKGHEKMYDKSETASKPDRFKLGIFEKNRRNLKLIQTCDFLFLCILYIIFYNVSRRDVKFHFITFSSSFPAMFLRPKILKSLLRRFFCRLVSLFLRFADPLLIVPMAPPFRTSSSCSGSVN